MITESIRILLGEELAQRVEEAIKGKGKDGKDIDLVVGNDGSFVPAEKYNGANSGKTSAENALKAAAEALKAIGGSGDPAKIADDVKAAQETIGRLQADHQREMAALQKNTALRMALADKVYDPADIIALLDLDKIQVNDKGELKSDLDALIKPIQEAKGYLFKEEKPAKIEIKGVKPAEPFRGDPTAGVDLSRMTYTQLAAYLAENPDAKLN